MLFARRRETSDGRENEFPRILARGQKTVIREFTRADIDQWIAWPRHTDPLWDNYNAPYMSTRQRDIYYRQHSTAPNSRQFSVDDLNGEYIGRISIRDVDWHAGTSVLGISFHPERLNKGLGTDALQAFLNFYFGKLGMNALFLDVAAFNTRAYRVYEKCGFRRCGERWGDPQPDTAGVFRKPEFQPIRDLFLWSYGFIRPLIYDMVIYKAEWEQARRESSGEEPARETVLTS